MSGVTLTVVATVAVVSLLALAGAVLLLVRRLKELVRRLGDVQRRLAAPLADVSAEVRVAERQVREIGTRRLG